MEHFLGLKEHEEKGLEYSFNSWEKWMKMLHETFHILLI